MPDVRGKKFLKLFGDYTLDCQKISCKVTLWMKKLEKENYEKSVTI